MFIGSILMQYLSINSYKCSEVTDNQLLTLLFKQGVAFLSPFHCALISVKITSI